MILNDKDYSRLIEKIKHLRISAMVSGNIQALAECLKEARIIRQTETPPDLVTMNSRVLVRRLDNDLDIEMSVVYHDDADSKNRKISVFAPVGMALLGLRESEIMFCQLPNGAVRYKICKILYQPEAAGDYHL